MGNFMYIMSAFILVLFLRGIKYLLGKYSELSPLQTLLLYFYFVLVLLIQFSGYYGSVDPCKQLSKKEGGKAGRWHCIMNIKPPHEAKFNKKLLASLFNNDQELTDFLVSDVFGYFNFESGIRWLEFILISIFFVMVMGPWWRWLDSPLKTQQRILYNSLNDVKTSMKNLKNSILGSSSSNKPPLAL